MFLIGLEQLFFFNLFQSTISAIIAALIGTVLAMTRHIITLHGTANHQHIKNDRNQGKKRWTALMPLGNMVLIIPFFLPTIISIFSLASILSIAHFQGLWAIITAHIYLNIPLAFMIAGRFLSNIPHQYWRMQGLYPSSIWPIIRPYAMQGFWISFAMIMILCLISFTPSFVLGGTNIFYRTFEVMIYQAVKYQMNMPLALFYVACQIMLVGGVFALMHFLKRFQFHKTVAADIQSTSMMPHQTKIPKRLLITAWMIYGAIAIIYLIILIQPFYQHISSYTEGLLWTNASLWEEIKNALIFSLRMGIVTGIIVFLCLSMLAYYLYKKDIDGKKDTLTSTHQLLLYLPYLLSPIVIAYGILMALWALSDGYIIDPWHYRFMIVLCVHSMLALPMAYFLFLPPIIQKWQSFRQTVTAYRLIKIADFIQLVARPFLMPIMFSCIAITGLFSISEFSIIALFGGDQNMVTLPFLLNDKMQHYAFDDANYIACLLCFIYGWVCFKLFANQSRTQPHESWQRNKR